MDRITKGVWFQAAFVAATGLLAFAAGCAGADGWDGAAEAPAGIQQGLAGLGPQTFDLQNNWQGLGGSYNGNTDAMIVMEAADTNFGALDACGVDFGGDYGRACVFKWLMPPPNTAKVTAASIILTLSNGTGSSYDVYQLLRPWNEASVTWNQRTAGSSWGLPGANSTGGATPDRSSTVLGSLTGGIGKRTITLNASGIAVVQSWVANPSTNNGLIIAGSATDGVVIQSSEYATIADRPILRVTYNLGP